MSSFPTFYIKGKNYSLAKNREEKKWQNSTNNFSLIFVENFSLLLDNKGFFAIYTVKFFLMNKQNLTDSLQDQDQINFDDVFVFFYLLLSDFLGLYLVIK